MDAVNNPYSPGAGLRPPELAGRDEEIASFEVLCERASVGRANQSIVLTGLRGVGKTVLLNDLAGRARRRGWIVAQVEARAESETAPSPFRRKVARSLNQSLREVTGSWGVGDRLRAALGTFKSFSLKTDPSGSVSLGIEVDPSRGRADSGTLEVDLTELAFDLAASATDLGVGVLVVVDEMQDLDFDELSAICATCHETGQRTAPFYVVGAGLPSLPGILAEARSYAERLFHYSRVGPLDPQAASVALLRPAEDAGAEWSDAASDLILTTSSGYPYFLQEFGKATWDYAPGPHIELADAEVGVTVGGETLDAGFFRSRWIRATPAEREYLTAMADDGEGPSASGEIARRLGKKLQSVGPTRANLIHKGLVYAPEHGQIAFTVPGMSAFIHRQRD
jgi:hypothetical protein